MEPLSPLANSNKQTKENVSIAGTAVTDHQTGDLYKNLVADWKEIVRKKLIKISETTWQQQKLLTPVPILSAYPRLAYDALTSVGHATAGGRGGHSAGPSS